MSFVAKLQRAREVLEQQGRLSVRALGRELELDADELDELIEEMDRFFQILPNGDGLSGFEPSIFSMRSHS